MCYGNSRVHNSGSATCAKAGGWQARSGASAIPSNSWIGPKMQTKHEHSLPCTAAASGRLAGDKRTRKTRGNDSSSQGQGQGQEPEPTGEGRAAPLGKQCDPPIVPLRGSHSHRQVTAVHKGPFQTNTSCRSMTVTRPQPRTCGQLFSFIWHEDGEEQDCEITGMSACGGTRNESTTPSLCQASLDEVAKSQMPWISSVPITKRS